MQFDVVLPIILYMQVIRLIDVVLPIFVPVMQLAYTSDILREVLQLIAIVPPPHIVPVMQLIALLYSQYRTGHAAYQCCIPRYSTGHACNKFVKIALKSQDK